MSAIFTDPNTSQGLAFLGVAVSITCSLVAGIAYRGKRGERYSPLNHFISELGEVGVSRLAWVFNIGLIVCGLCLVPFCVYVGLLLSGFLAKAGMVTGIITAIGISLVGVFPMNKLKPHAWAAMTFFRAGLLMVLLFSLAIALQKGTPPVLPRAYSLTGLPAVLAFSSFLWVMTKASKKSQANEEVLQPMEEERPKVWILPILEWAIFLTIIIWFLVIAFGW